MQKHTEKQTKKQNITMELRLLRHLRHLLQATYERILEYCALLGSQFRKKSNAAKNINERFSIKKEFANEGYVLDFLKERIKIASINRYRISIDNDFSSEAEEEIGKVTLECRGRYVDHATLTAGPSIGHGNRLIYWNFN